MMMMGFGLSERGEEHQSPPRAGADRHENGEDDQGHDEHDHTAGQALASFAYSEIRYANLSNFYRGNLSCGMISYLPTGDAATCRSSWSTSSNWSPICSRRRRQRKAEG
jgi:hypothetical protein